MERFHVTEGDFEALVQLSKYAGTELSRVERRYIDRFLKRIPDASDSVEDFEFLFDGGELDTSTSMTVDSSQQILHGFRISVDKIARAEGITTSSTPNEGEQLADGRESNQPEWLVRLHDRAQTWDPTDEADVEAGFGRFK